MEHTVCPTSEVLQSLPIVELLRVSVRTIRRRIRAGDLPAKRLKGGQTVLVEQSDVLALLEDVGGAV